MNRKIRICLECNGLLRSFLRIGLQDDGSISIGGLDKQFKCAGFTSETEVEGKQIRQYVDLEATHGIKAITNPHFTYHPSNYFQLGNTKHPKLFQGLVWSKPNELQGASSPWLRFISCPVKELKPLVASARKADEEIQCLQCPSEESSVGLNFDFAVAIAPTHTDGKSISKFIQWGEIILHYYGYLLPGQPASTAWIISG